MQTMSLAQESYIPPPAPTTAPVMDLSNMLGQGQQPYERYPTNEESTSPQAQLPPPPTSNIERSSSTVDNGRLYSLEIRQQPIRARMCGFGDKDRRPITPPPCIRLVVKDAQTGREIDINDIDTSYFVLSVDLWSADATKEVNLVRHSATSPSISAATSASYPPPNGATAAVYPQVDPHPVFNNPMNHQQAYPQPVYPQTYGQNPYPKQSELSFYQQAYKQMEHHPNSHHHHLPTSQPPAAAMPSATEQLQRQGYYTAAPVTPSTPTGQSGYYSQGPLLSPDQVPTSSDPRAQPAGMFTRNLIGSLCVSAFKLTDDTNKVGVWFVLQDLSVRTEGTFRLKMNFVNVGQTDSSNPTTPPASGAVPNPKTSPQHIGKLNTGSAPVLAACFSDSFDVYSAKKFPGVIESTKLSKCFATQGIKIPIRKDGVRGNDRASRDDDDE